MFSMNLFLSDDQEVAIVYFRAGYAPSHFKSRVVIEEYFFL